METGNRGRHKKTTSKYLKCWYLDRDDLICIDYFIDLYSLFFKVLFDVTELIFFEPLESNLHTEWLYYLQTHQYDSRTGCLLT